MNLAVAKKTGEVAVKKAGQEIMKNFGRLDKAEFKTLNDIFTKMDIRAEEIIIKQIRKEFPDASIYSEERGADIKGLEYTWLIDPIDGTINYFHGHAPFRIGVCLVKDDEPIMSFIFNPHSNELHFAQKGKGAFLNGKRIRVSKNQDLKMTIVQTHISSKIEARARTLLALGSIFREILHIRVLGCGLAAATYIADGKFDVFFNIETNPWDILGAALLVEEAGGKATDIEGRGINLYSTSMLATNGVLHKPMLEMLRNV